MANNNQGPPYPIVRQAAQGFNAFAQRNNNRDLFAQLQDNRPRSPVGVDQIGEIEAGLHRVNNADQHAPAPARPQGRRRSRSRSPSPSTRRRRSGGKGKSKKNVKKNKK